MSTLTEQIAESERTLARHLERRADTARKIVKNRFLDVPDISQIFIVVRDREHFYRLVKYCNRTYGHGSDKWTVRGRVLRYVDPKKAVYYPPAYKIWVVKQPNLDLSPLLLL